MNANCAASECGLPGGGCDHVFREAARYVTTTGNTSAEAPAYGEAPQTVRYECVLCGLVVYTQKNPPGRVLR